MNLGRFNIAAKHQKEVAELYENDNQIEEAMEAFNTAAELYEGEGSNSSANLCFLKVAYAAAQLEQYSTAIEIYERIANDSIDNHLIKYSVKDYCLRAGLCHLCVGDIVAAQQALEKYTGKYPSFGSTRECCLLTVSHLIMIPQPKLSILHLNLYPPLKVYILHSHLYPPQKKLHVHNH